jgi:hypothetical protein
MSTLWWLVVLWLVAMFSFSLGYIIRSQMQVWSQINDYIDSCRRDDTSIVRDRERLGA